jgi:tetratricopeptide (TPR) repeat protein
VLLAASAFALGVTKIEDWDAWTHLALGREMVRGGAFPAHEPFNFPSVAMPYHNTEWLFDVMLYLAYVAAGFAGVIALKAGLASLTAVILWKDSGLGRDPGLDETLPAVIRAAVLFPLLLIICHRFVERPDLVLMVFLSFTIYALNAYLYQGRRYLYALPAIQLLWVNMHPSALLALVPFGAFLVGGQALRLIQRWRGVTLPGTPSPAQLKTVAMVLAAVMLASAANPHGLSVLIEPLRLTNYPWLLQHVVEMQAAPFMHSPAPVIVTVLLVLTSLALAKRVPIMPVLLFAPFVYLGFSAQRFVFLFAIVAAPIVARNVGVMAGMLTLARARRVCLGFASSAVLLTIVAIGLAVAHVEPLADPTRVPGIGVNDRFLPEQALRYLDDAGLTGRVFNTFHWGGYLAWRDFPRRAAIIDGRGYVPPGLQETIHFAHANPELLERLRQAYGFDIVLVAYPGLPNDVGALPERALSSAWALVYWDDVAAVFVRRSEHLAHIISRDEYHRVNPGNGVPYLRRALTDHGKLPEIEAELRRNVAQTGSSIGYTLLGFARLEARDYDHAIEAFHRAQGYSSVWHASQGLALAYWQKGDLTRAIHYYQALSNLSEDPTFLFNIGLGLVQLGNDREAVGYLERTRAKDPQFLPVYQTLSDAYQRLGLPERQREVSAAHSTALRAAQASEHQRRAAGLRRTGHLEAALAELDASLRLDPGNPTTLSSLGEVYLQQGRLDDAIRLHRAILEAYPRFASAHYALGTAYRRRGNHGDARRHLEEYVRLEPAGYQAWQARQTLSQLPR